MTTHTTTRRNRQDKPTIRIQYRTVNECAGLVAAFHGALELGLPTPDFNR